MNYPPITSVMLVVTHACNLRCRYCFVQKEPETMTLQTAKDVVDFLIGNCQNDETPSINFFGGEPMMCWDNIIEPLTRYIREELKAPFHLSVTTNGTLLTPERLAFMKENQIGMLLSIDGDAKTQDYNRPYADGRGSFEALRPMLEEIARDFRPTFRMTTIPATCGNLFADIQFARSAGFSNFFVVPNIFEEWSAESWETLGGEVRKYGDHFIESYENGETPIRFSTFEEALRNITKINNAVSCGSCRVGCHAGRKCGLGTARFASVHPSGDVYACQEMTSNEGQSSIFWIGNIYNGVSEERRAALASLFDSKKVTGADCGKCKLRRICDGGCVANNYLVNGDVNRLPTVYCRWMQMLLNEAIRVMWALSKNERFIAEWRKSYGSPGT